MLLPCHMSNILWYPPKILWYNVQKTWLYHTLCKCNLSVHLPWCLDVCHGIPESTLEYHINTMY